RRHDRRRDRDADVRRVGAAEGPADEVRLHARRGRRGREGPNRQLERNPVIKTKNPLVEALGLGQSIWYDNIRRSLITSGELERLVAEDGLRGVTSNPAIFEKAITGSNDYTDELTRLRAEGVTGAKELYEQLAVRDIQDAADILRPVFDETEGADGYVSL